MLTLRQLDLLQVIRSSIAERGCSPTFDEMSAALGLHSKSNVSRLLDSLENKGFIRRRARTARTIEILRMPDGPYLRLPEALHKRLRERASAEKVTVDDLAGVVIRRFLNDSDRQAD